MTYLNEENRTISINAINMDCLEHSFKECYTEKINQETSDTIIILFDEEGNFTGHLFGFNSSYSTEDLRSNGDYKLSESDLEILEILEIENWKNEVNDLF